MLHLLCICLLRRKHEIKINTNHNIIKRTGVFEPPVSSLISSCDLCDPPVIPPPVRRRRRSSRSFVSPKKTSRSGDALQIPEPGRTWQHRPQRQVLRVANDEQDQVNKASQARRRARGPARIVCGGGAPRRGAFRQLHGGVSPPSPPHKGLTPLVPNAAPATPSFMQRTQDFEPPDKCLPQPPLAGEVWRREGSGAGAHQDKDRRVMIGEAHGARSAAVMLPAVQVGMLGRGQAVDSGRMGRRLQGLPGLGLGLGLRLGLGLGLGLGGRMGRGLQSLPARLLGPRRNDDDEGEDRRTRVSLREERVHV